MNIVEPTVTGMAPIQMKEILIFSSEDSRYPAQNLLKGQKWMTNSDDSSGKAVLEIQLQKASQIHYIDIGYCNVASLEVTVGRSSWPSSREQVVLLPTVILQTPMDARAGRNKTGCRMFNYLEHLNSDRSNEKWDKVRINLHQPFVRNKQMGLEFIRLGSPRNTAQNNERENVKTCEKTSSWKNSSIAKLAGFKHDNSPKIANHLEDKLLRISSTIEDGSSEKNTLSRTAKMVLSSRREKSGSNAINSTSGYENLTKTALKSPGFIRTTPKLGHLTPQPRKKILRNDINNMRSKSLGGSSRNSDNSGSSTSKLGNSTPQPCKKILRIDINNKRSKSLGGSYELPQNSENSGSSANKYKEQGVISKLSQGEDSNNYKFKETDSMSTTSDNKHEKNDKTRKAESEENLRATPDSELSKSEVKRIKDLIQRFFNSFDMEQMDPDKITLRELRTSFEAINDVTLDKDGRQYFRNITSNYLELAMAVKQHKEKASEKTSGCHPTTSNSITCNTPTRKRKSAGKSEKTSVIVDSPIICIGKSRPSSPAKIRRISHENGLPRSRVHQNSTNNQRHRVGESDCEIISVENHRKDVQCPLCMRMFPESIIADHASICGEEDIVETFDLQNHDNDLQITSVTHQPLRPIHPKETTLDLSDNMRLSEAEKKHWINFSKKPKPYHPRMDKALFKGCKLVKCPTCAQYYKSQEIEEHSNECADKVNSGFEKRGLYYVKKTSETKS